MALNIEILDTYKRAKIYIFVQNYKISAPSRATGVRSGKHTQVGQQHPADTKRTQFQSRNRLFFSLISCSLSLQIFAVLLRCEIMHFFASKRNEIFASISIFASEA
jgi:hypothetical protein